MKTSRLSSRFKTNLPLYLMLIPGLIFVTLFVYTPLAGSFMAFQQYSVTKGYFESPFVGLQNFEMVMRMPGFWDVIRNTVVISLFKIIGNIVVPVTFALLLNELLVTKLKRVFQTFIYLPYFISWVILSGIIMDMLSPSTGVINNLLGMIGIDPIFFLGDKTWFPVTIVFSDIWKNFGFGTVIYLAALTGIDSGLYEASMIDGANRWKQTWHITIPGIVPTIILMTVLGFGDILNAGFDQVYNLLSPSVYETGDIIDTFVYRLGIEQRQYSLSAAVGLMKSVISFLFISVGYKLADKLADYRIF